MEENEMKTKKVPVLFTIFNRKDVSVEAFQSIKKYQPERLYIAADGPRKQKNGEDEKCEETRKAVLEEIDWPCEVKTLFRDENLGCAQAMYGAISWLFEYEQWGVIVEDDIIISSDFFNLCEVLLPRYANNEKIMEIVAQNRSLRSDISNSYVFSYRENCWGWASWARAWEKMDMSMSYVPEVTFRFLKKKLGVFEALIQLKNFRTAYNNIIHLTSWAIRWNFCILINDGLVIVPGVNMAVNIGTDGGTHYCKGDADPYSHLHLANFAWPIEYNDSFSIDKRQSSYDEKDFFRVRMIGLRKKVKKMFL